MKLVSRRLAALVFCLLVITASIPTLPAQQTKSQQTDSEKETQKKEETKEEQKVAKSNKQKGAKKTVTKPMCAKKTKTKFQISNPVSFVNTTTQPEFLVGQAKVVVKGNQDPIIRLGIARNGSTVVEFPASDNFFALHPGGSSDIVTVDESPALATDHFLVFRAGKDFVSSLPNTKNNDTLKATISVQMESGMFITLMFYPVSDVTLMAHRVVVTYSREEIVAARREAGLAVNLGMKNSEVDVTQVSLKNANIETLAKEAESVNSNTSDDPKQNADKNKDLTFEVKQALQAAVNKPQKFTVWSKPLHGLSISTLAPVDIDREHQLVIIAVKNTTSKNLRLIEGNPDVDVLTLGGKGSPVLIHSLAKLHVETTTAQESIPANSTVYYAVLYEPPVLSVNQRIRFSVTNREAADEPATIFLSR